MEVRSQPSVKVGEVTSPEGEKFDLFPIVVIPTENSRGDLLVVCRGSKPAGDSDLDKIRAAFAEVAKKLGGLDGVEVKVVGPFKGAGPTSDQIAQALRGLSEATSVDPCCQKPEPEAPAKPKPRRKAAVKKPARRRR